MAGTGMGESSNGFVSAGTRSRPGCRNRMPGRSTPCCGAGSRKGDASFRSRRARPGRRNHRARREPHNRRLRPHSRVCGARSRTAYDAVPRTHKGRRSRRRGHKNCCRHRDWHWHTRCRNHRARNFRRRSTRGRGASLSRNRGGRRFRSRSHSQEPDWPGRRSCRSPARSRNRPGKEERRRRKRTQPTRGRNFETWVKNLLQTGTRWDGEANERSFPHGLGRAMTPSSLGRAVTSVVMIGCTMVAREARRRGRGRGKHPQTDQARRGTGCNGGKVRAKPGPDPENASRSAQLTGCAKTAARRGRRPPPRGRTVSYISRGSPGQRARLDRGIGHGGNL